MNAVLSGALPLDAIMVCYHTQDDDCACRKPKPGMILEAALEFDVNLKRSFMIGDRRGDMLAGTSAGCQTIFLDRGYRQSEHPVDDEADFVVTSLADAVDYILSHTGE